MIVSVNCIGVDGASVRKARMGSGQSGKPARAVTYKRVDTCAAEFEAHTPYLYSTYGSECEARPTDRKKVIILGGGPNRIGQGIEFDYCCVHAAMALREEGVESIMVNCNPETVSTDYDTSDRLYFEPLTEEDVLNIVQREQPLGVVLQFGGQTPVETRVAALQSRGENSRARVRRRSIGRKIGNGSAISWISSDCARPRAAWPAPSTKRCGLPGRSPIPSWCGLPMCWAGDPCRLCTMKPICWSTCDRRSRPRRNIRC